MEKIKVNHELTDFMGSTVELYDNNDNFIDIVDNVPQTLNVRIQIAQNKLKGYYFIIDKEIKVDILENGEVKGWPKNFGNTTLNKALELRNLQIDDNELEEYIRKNHEKLHK